ncbi:MAG: hypothetical protein JSS57_21910 [Proteobacteria bacterium]|nr:hypothetical protein [Pseudomonadota bacterium]RTL38721.1 MAG: hypothetical protein EKK49_04360 [Rhodocyclaceae bacterium]
MPLPRGAFPRIGSRNLIALALATLLGAGTLSVASTVGAFLLDWTRGLDPDTGSLLRPALVVLAGVFLGLGVLLRRSRTGRRKR